MHTVYHFTPYSQVMCLFPPISSLFFCHTFPKKIPWEINKNFIPTYNCTLPQNSSNSDQIFQCLCPYSFYLKFAQKVWHCHPNLQAPLWLLFWLLIHSIEKPLPKGYSIPEDLLRSCPSSSVEHLFTLGTSLIYQPPWTPCDKQCACLYFLLPFYQSSLVFQVLTNLFRTRLNCVDFRTVKEADSSEH